MGSSVKDIEEWRSGDDHSGKSHDGERPTDGDVQISRIRTSGNQGEYVHLGDKTYLRSDLMYAFGGNFNPGLAPAPRLKLGNASPMGLFSFATTTLILSFINAGARGVKTDSIMLGCALFYGGCVQIIAGVWELIVENTFGATVFTAYGGFWLAFGVITMNGFNIASSYKSDVEFDNAMGLFMLAWALVTSFFTVCTLRSTVAMFSLLFFLTLTFILLSASFFCGANATGATASKHLGTAGGVVGCITAFIAYYNAMAGLMNKENSWINVRPLYMPGALRPEPASKEKEA